MIGNQLFQQYDQVAIILALSRVLPWLFVPFGQPAVVGEIVKDRNLLFPVRHAFPLRPMDLPF
jgi:hypothetical protein